MSLKDFEILKDIGTGSFGIVFLVKRHLDNKKYALKRVKLSKLTNKEKINSLNEIRFLASLSHQNIIGYKESFFEDNSDTLNLVLEYADDGDLQSKIFYHKKLKCYFKEKIIWSYFIQMVKGLKILHDNNLIHRDLKSANIFLMKNGICKLGDLNITKLYKDDYLNLKNSQMGTPCYAAPEIWNDKGYSFKSDIWSLGCILYELCTLDLPFGERNIKEVYFNIMKGKYNNIPKHYSKEMEIIINLLLQKDPKKRPSCNEILENKIIVKVIDNLFGFFGADKKRNNSHIMIGNNMNSVRDNNDIKNLLPNFNNYEYDKRNLIPISHKKVFSGYSTECNFNRSNNNYNQNKIKRNLSFQSKNDNDVNYRNNSFGVIRAKNNSKNIINELETNKENCETENNIHEGILNLNLNNIASDKKKNLMKHYSFQNGIGIGVGILSSKNREKFSKKLINENSKVNNKIIEEENFVNIPNSRKNIINITNQINNKKNKIYSSPSTKENSIMSSYHNTHSNESKENNDEHNILKNKVDYIDKRESKYKNNLSSLLNRISIPNKINTNKQMFLNQKNLNHLIKLNTIES